MHVPCTDPSGLQEVPAKFTPPVIGQAESLTQAFVGGPGQRQNRVKLFWFEAQPSIPQPSDNQFRHMQKDGFAGVHLASDRIHMAVYVGGQPAPRHL